MNVERLNTIVRALRAELQTKGIPDAVVRLASAMQNLAGNPGQAQFQSELSTALTEIRTGLDGAPTDDYPASWRQTMTELRIDDLFGQVLLDEINTIVAENQLSPSIGAEQLQPIADRLAQVVANLDRLSQGLAYFEIPFEDDLEPGAVELSLLIPRDEVKNDLYHLGREFQRIERIVKPFSEIALGSSPEHLNVRAIASSDFGVYVDLPLQVGAMIATSVAYLMHEYKTLLEIRRLRQELENNAVPTEALNGLDQYTASQMTIAIETETGRVTAGLKKSGRDNELRLAVKQSLNDFVVRIDHGYSIDIRVAEPEVPDDPDDEDAQTVAPDVAAGIAKIQNAAENLKFIRPGGRPILTLLPGGAGKVADNEDNEDGEGGDGS